MRRFRRFTVTVTLTLTCSLHRLRHVLDDRVHFAVYYVISYICNVAVYSVASAYAVGDTGQHAPNPPALLARRLDSHSSAAAASPRAIPVQPSYAIAYFCESLLSNTLLHVEDASFRFGSCSLRAKNKELGWPS